MLLNANKDTKFQIVVTTNALWNPLLIILYVAFCFFVHFYKRCNRGNRIRFVHIHRSPNSIHNIINNNYAL